MSNTYGQTIGLRLVELSTALLGRRTRTAPAPPVASVHEATAMKCTRTDSATECLLRIEGALDVHNALEIRAIFDSVVGAERDLVTVDLELLTMLDSSGVGAIVSLFKRVKATGGEVVVKNVGNQPLAVCKLLKLDRVFGF